MCCNTELYKFSYWQSVKDHFFLPIPQMFYFFYLFVYLKVLSLLAIHIGSTPRLMAWFSNVWKSTVLDTAPVLSWPFRPSITQATAPSPSFLVCLSHFSRRSLGVEGSALLASTSTSARHPNLRLSDYGRLGHFSGRASRVGNWREKR